MADVEFVMQGTGQWAALRDEFVEAQVGGCAICGVPFADGRPAVLDHCHATGMIRGALCGGCNTRLGWYEAKRREIETYLAKAAEFAAHRVSERMPRSDRLRHYWQHKALD